MLNGAIHSGTVHMTRDQKRLIKLSHLLSFTLISHLLGAKLLQAKHDGVFLSAASNLSVAFFLFCHIQQALLRDPMMDENEHQKRTKSLTPQSVSSKSFMSVSSPPFDVMSSDSTHKPVLNHVTPIERKWPGL